VIPLGLGHSSATWPFEVIRIRQAADLFRALFNIAPRAGHLLLRTLCGHLTAKRCLPVRCDDRQPRLFPWTSGFRLQARAHVCNPLQTSNSCTWEVMPDGTFHFTIAFGSMSAL
jgi:hypothetical protein